MNALLVIDHDGEQVSVAESEILAVRSWIDSSGVRGMLTLPGGGSARLRWRRDTERRDALHDAMAAAMGRDGISLHGTAADRTRLTVRHAEVRSVEVLEPYDGKLPAVRVTYGRAAPKQALVVYRSLADARSAALLFERRIA